jgi:predicted membrane-bound spermidine synthase
VKRFFLLATCFLMGFAVLGLELLGFRLYGPEFGYSSYVAGTLIGVILAALSLGYILGGRLADRAPRPPVLYRLIVITGLLLVAFTFVYDKLLSEFFLKFGMIKGLVLVTVLIYGPPMVLLGMVSPFIIRLVAKRDQVGTAAGTIYALSTVGSIFGSFLTPFVLVPAIGAHMTLVIMTAIVLSVGVIGLLGVRSRYAVALLALGLMPLSFPKLPANVVLRIQSPYSDLAVEKDAKGGPYRLAVNRWAWYSRGLPKEITTGYYYDYFLLGPMLTPVKEMAVLGAAAGTSIKQFQDKYPDIHIDAVEIDPWVIQIAKMDYFKLREGPNLAIHIQDARPFLRLTTKRYDLVEIDMFQGGPFVPFYVTTKEFFQLVSDRMSGAGVAMTNVLGLSNDQLLLACIVETMKTVFPSVYVIHLSSNHLVIGFKEKTSLETARARLKGTLVQSLAEFASTAADELTTPDPYPGMHVFTDDKADVARITFNMVKRHADLRRRERLLQRRQNGPVPGNKP